MSELNLIGGSLGRFEIVSELGRGGMAVVYRARQADLDREVALKVLPPALTHDTSYVARFRQEARSAARLEHPHIVPIYEVGEAEGLHYIAMKFIQGGTLKELLEREAPLPVPRAAQILAQVGAALDYAHRQGVIHRDIKPSNMMITPEGWIYLTDFGLARGTGGTGGLTMAGTVMGTPEYMSPEQAQGLPNVGPPTDIYALGVVLYEMLTGVFPFQADTPMGMLAARLLQAPTPPRDVRSDLPPAAEDVVMRALARKPEARFASAAEMVESLRNAAGLSESQAQRPLSPAAGMPALGATIVAGQAAHTPPPQATPLPTLPATPTPTPYVRPAEPTQAAAATRLAGTPAPNPLPPLPRTPAATASPAGGSKTALWLGLGAGGLLLLLIVIGGIVFMASRPDNPALPQDNPGIAALIRDGDPQLLASRNLDAAEDTTLAALADDDGDLTALAKLALISSLHGDPNAAVERADALIDAAGSDNGAAALGYALRADALLILGNVPAALEAADSAVERDPELALGHALRSNVLAYQAALRSDIALMDEALAALDQAADVQIDESALLQALTVNALAYTESLEYSLSGNQAYRNASEDSYNQAIDLAPDLALFHSNLGYLFNSEDATDDARAQFTAALERDPNFVGAQAGIGWSYYIDNDDTEAAEAFEAAIALDDADYGAYYGLGRLAFDERDYEEAAAQFAAAAERNDQNPEVQAYLAEAQLFLGFNSDDADEKADYYSEAEAAYRNAISFNPDYAFAMSGLGWILQYQEEYDESVEWFEQALVLDEQNDETFNGLGWSLFNLDRFDEAEPAFRQAIELDDSYASAHYGLGRTLEELGRTAEAREYYQATLELDPEYEDAQEALDQLDS